LTAAHVRALIRTPTLDAASSNGATGQEGHADRRHAGKAIVLGGFAAALAPRSALERITSHGDRPVDSKLVTDHEDVADAFAIGHRTGDPVVLGDLVAAHADMMSGLLDRAMSPADRQRLEVIAVASHAQAGMLALNLADRPRARPYFALARDITGDSGDATLFAQSYSVSSLLHSSVPRGKGGKGRGRALTLLSQAADSARSSDTPTRWTVQRWLAEELAAAHNESGFRQTIAAIESLIGKIGHHDGRQFFARRCPVTPEGVRLSTGIGLVRLGLADEAASVLEAARMPAPPRRTMVTLTEIGAVRALQGEPEGACASLMRALDVALDAGFLGGIDRIRGIRATFPPAWNALRCMQELDERLRMC
jgi:hypothetical protein